MYITLIICTFILISITFSFIRAIAGKYSVHPFDWISMIFAACVTFLMVYYKVI